ncbi:MAG: hypothetical protein IIU46_06310, partial [Treponema sp.]|nr:hypothetical protein [Treponema sp.]
MKYPIDKELKSISIYSGSMVGRLYPLVNFMYGFIKCKSDDFVIVKKYSTPGFDGAEISTLVIEPRQYEGELPCIMFFHGGGFSAIAGTLTLSAQNKKGGIDAKL